MEWTTLREDHVHQGGAVQAEPRVESALSQRSKLQSSNMINCLQLLKNETEATGVTLNPKSYKPFTPQLLYQIEANDLK